MNCITQQGLHLIYLRDCCACSTYNAMLGGCKGGQWKRALELFTDMRTAGLQPDCDSYTSTMHAWQEGGQWEAALQLFSEMQVWHLCSLLK